MRRCGLLLALLVVAGCDPADACTSRADCNSTEHCIVDVDAGQGRCVAAPGREDPEPPLRVVGQTPAIDVLLVVDDAPDGLEPQRRTIASLPALLDEAQWQGARLRIAATTTSVASPICNPGTAASSGALAATSCLDRLDDFVLPDGTDVSSLCTDACTKTSAELGLEAGRPWIDVDALPPEIDPIEAASCLVAQGVAGCELAAPLAAVQRSLASSDPAWQRGQSRPRVVMVTPGIDCSITDEGAAAFDPAGDRALWPDPEAAMATPALCWRVAAQCDGQPPELSPCRPAAIGLDGEVAHRTEPKVLLDLDTLEETLGLPQDVLLLAVVGTDDGGGVRYSTDGDPAFVETHGVAPGCSDGDLSAAPPIRITSLDDGRTSICAPTYDDVLRDATVTAPALCRTPAEAATLTVRYVQPVGGTVDIPECEGTDPVRTVPANAPACFAWRPAPTRCFGDDLELVLRTTAASGFGVFEVSG